MAVRPSLRAPGRASSTCALNRDMLARLLNSAKLASRLRNSGPIAMKRRPRIYAFALCIGSQRASTSATKRRIPLLAHASGRLGRHPPAIFHKDSWSGRSHHRVPINTSQLVITLWFSGPLLLSLQFSFLRRYVEFRWRTLVGHVIIQGFLPTPFITSSLSQIGSDLSENSVAILFPGIQKTGG